MRNFLLLNIVFLMMFLCAAPLSAATVSSEWILSSQVPAGAVIVDEKWTYDQKVYQESQNSFMSGWTLESSYWKQSNNGSFNYASFPSSSYYSTSDQYYKSYQKSAYTSYETSTSKRVVSTKANGYIFYHWAFPDSYSDGDNLIGDYYGEWGPAHTTQATIWESFYSAGTGTQSSYTDDAGSRWVYKFTGHSNHSYWWFRLNVYQCSYTDYVKMYKFYRTESKESATPVTASSTITNVKHWVKVADSSSVGFTDVPNNAWYATYVNDLVAQGILNGRTPTTFDPEGTITRAEFAKILAVASGENLNSYDGASQFTDCTNHWAKKYINWAAAKGIVTGVGNGKFAPDAKITREALCTMVWRYSKYKGIYPEKVNAPISFSDDGSISAWAKEAVYIMQKAGVLNGKGNNCFDPQGNAKRGECAKVICVYQNCKNDTAACNNLKKLRDYVAKDNLDCQFYLADVTHDGLDDVIVLGQMDIDPEYLYMDIYSTEGGNVESVFWRSDAIGYWNPDGSRGVSCWILKRPEGDYIVKYSPDFYMGTGIGIMNCGLYIEYYPYIKDKDEQEESGLKYGLEYLYYQSVSCYSYAPSSEYYELMSIAKKYTSQSILIANPYDLNTPNDAWCTFNYTPSSFSTVFGNLGK